MLILAPYFIISEWSNYGAFTLILGVPLWLIFFLPFRDMLCPFVINEKGITSKLLFFRNICITWDEMKYIGVGTRQIQGDQYRFIMYFSKVPLKKICFGYGNTSTRHTKRHFFINYKYGLLEEVLKYVEEEKIQNIDKIKDCPYPAQRQGGKMSKELEKEFKVDWDA